ncbi:hypothetical protein [Janthinobacterium sp. PAMC25594]|uniref:hypothetical protein n=1 Tax=Janthinobacterium sp. PAMC25594 TaxID=2861284 RepID=UPI001C634D22|nr:hypothetical protein [Janthinobacterium sp. PAMC25594]QYG06845.1 hypothetical protein KY494_27070 [Janthinobacterium sp. PAMC25594]
MQPLSLYALAGSLNSLFIVVSLYGLWSQLQKIWRRKRDAGIGAGQTTNILSLNQFSVSFLAYCAFFVYGYSITPFNHYIVWPRLLASLIALAILYEIDRDRRSLASRNALLACALLLCAGVAGLAFGPTFSDEKRVISQSLIVTVTVLLAQGYAHQIRLIWRSGKTGAVSLKMSQFILAMDVSTIFFACVMGLKTGWPLLLLASVSATTKLAIMWLFRWEKISSAAQIKRQAPA